MGKGTDKMYITHSEWSNKFGGMSFGGANPSNSKVEGFKRLPFNCCSLSLTPFVKPVCTEDGIIFDLENIANYLKRNDRNPVNGKKLEFKSLIRLNFHKNSQDEYCCPVTYQTFTNYTHIVAIKTTGNVYSFETIETLNLKSHNFKDLVNDEPFNKSDIITIQNPKDIVKQDVSNFWHVKNKRNNTEPIINRNNMPSINSKGTIKKVMKELENKKLIMPKNKVETVEHSLDPKLKLNVSTGKVAASLTATHMTPVTQNEAKRMDKNAHMYKSIKEKAYVQISTNMGNLNIELYCDKAPKTTHNFISLCKTNYYNNTIFHRNIPNFMIQGGDPSGTGKGGESFFKKDFEDEFNDSLLHSKRGILSMANKGKNTNSSQFFILYRKTSHLDKKHTVFGCVVGGISTLDKMEKIPVGKNDVPKEEIKIIKTTVFSDPFEEFENRGKRKLKHIQENETKTKDDGTTWFGTRIHKEDVVDKVGKYIQNKEAESKIEPKKDHVNAKPSYNIAKMGTYGNFDNW